MREVKMAELQFEAPLAKFDGEDWNDYNEFQTASDIENSNRPPVGPLAFKKGHGSSAVDNFRETISDSLEDLVNTFDEKITKCFCNFDEKVEQFAPVQVRSQEEIMKDCQMWWTITGNYGNILPIDWSKSYTQQLQEKSLKLGEKRERDSSDLDLSEDEELSEAFDIHSLIISSLQQEEEEPMYNADEVIDEIEGMMEDSDDDESLPPCDLSSCDMTPTPTGSDIVNSMTANFLPHRDDSQASSINLEDSLKALSVSSLNELYDELEHTFRDNSEVLITSLALRDEQEYEKELKNQFISLLLGVQKKRQMNKKRYASNKKQKSTTGAEPGTYLTTVIPYHLNQGPPTIEQLQIYIKILEAVNDDSSTVPGLLTDYILKVLCPTI